MDWKPDNVHGKESKKKKTLFLTKLHYPPQPKLLTSVAELWPSPMFTVCPIKICLGLVTLFKMQYNKGFKELKL